MFNRSRHTFSYGSPDIVPIFCAQLPHATWNSYSPDFEDFATGLVSLSSLCYFSSYLHFQFSSLNSVVYIFVNY